MLALIVIALFAAALKAALVALEAWSLRRIQATVVFSSEDVEEIIEDALKYLRGGRWPKRDWYHFIHARLRDPQLESIRLRCAKYGDHFPFQRRENEFQGMETALEPILQELRVKAGRGVRQPRSRPEPDVDTFEDGYSRSHANGAILWVAERQLWRGTRWYIAVSRPYVEWEGATMMTFDDVDECPQTLDGARTHADELSGCPQPCSCPAWGQSNRTRAPRTVGTIRAE